MRRVTQILLPLVFVVLAQSLARGAEDTHSKILPSCVWVVVPEGERLGIGTGCVIDRDEKLVLSCLHVMKGQREAIVFFPLKDKNGLVTEAAEYAKRRSGIKAKLVASDSDRDLVLLKLDRLPDDVSAIPLADGPVAVGKKVFAVGNSGNDGKSIENARLWHQYSSKVAASIFSKQILDGKQQVRAWALRLEGLVRQGDSGGPLVDAEGRLVGVVFAEDKKNGFAIDVDEVRVLLERHRQRNSLSGRWNVEFETQDKQPKFFKVDFRDGGSLDWIMDKKHTGKFELKEDKLKMSVPTLKIEETVTIKRIGDDRFTFSSGGIEFVVTRR